MTGSLFDFLESSGILNSNPNWVPDAPPQLDRIHDIELNVESTGLRWWDKDKPISISIGWADASAPNGYVTRYLPWGHRGGGNLNEETVKRWAQRELRGKRITNLNTRFDVHMLREWGVDLEAQGNEVSDVGHYAALLDDHRLKNNLDQLIKDYLNETPMLRLDESHMASYHAGEAAARSMYNISSVYRLKEVMWPQLNAQNLQTVRALEDKVIYTVCEMEKNGFPIDLELLDKWLRQSKEQVQRMLLSLSQLVGFQCNPDSPKDQERVFRQLHLPLEYTHKGAPSFTDKILKRIEHPTIQLMRRCGKLTSLRNKFLLDTDQNMCPRGVLRYAFHQLRTAKDEFADAGEAGTITGRFSSSAFIRNEFGVNIQQRSKPAKQRISFGYDEKDHSHDGEIFLVRKLHVAGSGLLLASDMDQAQYRIFAHHINNPKINQAYKDNPGLSFHKYMHERLASLVTMSYGQQKDLNFSYIFGAGVTKMANMMGFITDNELQEIRDMKMYDSPKLRETKEIKAIFEQEVPELKDLMDLAMHLAKPECDSRCKNKRDRFHQLYPHRGYVSTFLGRRGRYPDGQRLHKAFNFVDQGTEADYMKTKLVELHEARHETQLTLRVTNHDEIVGDVPDLEHAKKVHNLLSQQSFDLRIPLTWATGVGPNWAECKEI